MSQYNSHGRNSDSGYSFEKASPKKLNSASNLSHWFNDVYKKIRFGISSNSSYRSGGNFFDRIKKPLLYTLIALLSTYMVWVFAFVYLELPPLTSEGLSHINFSKTSVVTDKNGEALYKFYEENRQYVSYDKISEQAVNAFVAIEDQSFWTNEGIDIKGVFRAIFSTVRSSLGLGGRSGGASTITQQLLKNILKLNENESGFYDKLVRKHKERLLVGKLSSVIQSEVKKKFPSLSSDEIDLKKKERVMELYLNYIYLGNQAYGIEAAAQSYFGKTAKDLSLVESSILASMPQAPTKYNPYKHPTMVMGTLRIRDAQGENVLSGSMIDSIIEQISGIIFADTTTIKPGNNSFQNYIAQIVPKTLTVDGSIYQILYEAGRKDAVLNRMYEDSYITQDQLKRAFIDGLGLKLQAPRIDIKAPHFVFYIKDLLTKDDPRFKDLGITEEVLYGGGIQIKTSLDLNIQKIAEKSITNNMPLLLDRGGTNRSLLHIDTTNGDVLAYVGSADYNNVANQGQNDMVRSARQPGSSIKPLIYSYALQTLPIALDTPIYDIPLSVGSFTPNNADGKFEGLLPLREALAHSRNIPAVKAYLAAGKEAELKPFLQGLGLKSLRNSTSYGYSLALGAGEVPMLEMAQAYSYLSQKGEAMEINPILEIRGADGQILYQKEPKKLTSVLKSGPAYLIWKILSDPANMPAGWVRYYAISGFKYAVKSGTSNKVITLNGKEKSLPRDGWLATYTPSRVTLYRGGNADDKPMNANALGLLLNSEVNKSFYTEMLSNKYIKNEDMSPVDVSTVSLSKVTGKIATKNTPLEYVVKSLAFNDAIGLDTNLYTPVSIDISCVGKASPLTPSEQLARAYVFTPVSITSADIESINKRYMDGARMASGSERNKNVDYDFPFLITKQPTDYCTDRTVELSDDIQLSTNISEGQSIPYRFTLSYTVQSTESPIQKVSVTLGDLIVGTYNYNDFDISDRKIVRIRNLTATGNQTLQITAIAENNKIQTLSLPVNLTTDDIVVPEPAPTPILTGSIPDENQTSSGGTLTGF